MVTSRNQPGRSGPGEAVGIVSADTPIFGDKP
jgi:hypothetical protein